MEDLTEAWFAAHFSHLTPGTPEHHVASRAKADLLERLRAKQKKPDPKPATPQ